MKLKLKFEFYLNFYRKQRFNIIIKKFKFIYMKKLIIFCLVFLICIKASANLHKSYLKHSHVKPFLHAEEILTS